MSIAEKVDAFLEKDYPQATSVIYRDLSLNFKKILEDSPLEPHERFSNLLSIAVALESKAMIDFAKSQLDELGLAREAIQECAEIAAIMGMNNAYYKFKSYLPADIAAKDYVRSGLRMSSVSKSINTKKDFEMMALSVSIINACSVCVASHEKTARSHDVSTEKIHDLARLAAVSKGLHSLKKAMTL